jgi:hypothetical protein
MWTNARYAVDPPPCPTFRSWKHTLDQLGGMTRELGRSTNCRLLTSGMENVIVMRYTIRTSGINPHVARSDYAITHLHDRPFRVTTSLASRRTRQATLTLRRRRLAASLPGAAGQPLELLRRAPYQLVTSPPSPLPSGVGSAGVSSGPRPHKTTGLFSGTSNLPGRSAVQWVLPPRDAKLTRRRHGGHSR